MIQQKPKHFKEIERAPFVFYSKGQIFSSVNLTQPTYGITYLDKYNYQFDLPVFHQKNIDNLTIRMTMQDQVSQDIIDWHIAVLKNFTFKSLEIEMNTISNYFKRIFDLQPNLETFQLIYFPQELKYASDFLTCQDKIKSLKNLSIIMQSIRGEQHNYKKCVAQFVSDNIDTLQQLQLVLDIRALLITLKEIINSNKKDYLSEGMQDICLCFRSLNFQIEQLFHEEQQNNSDDQLLLKFFQKFKGLNKISLIFQQALFDIKFYKGMCDVLEFQLQFKQLKELVFYISHSRIQFDLIDLFLIIQQYKSLEKLKINLDFSTQVMFSKPQQIIQLDQIQHFILSLAYCPCSNHIIEYISFNKLKQLSINLNYINNEERQSQNIQNLQYWIQDNPKLEDLSISVWNSANQDYKEFFNLLKLIQEKLGSIQKLSFEGLPVKLMEVEQLAILQNIQNWYISFDNLTHFSFLNNELQIKNNQEQNIHFNIIQQIVSYTKISVKTVLLKVQNFIFESGQNEQENLEAFKNLFTSCSRIQSMNLQIQYFSSNTQFSDVLIHLIEECQNLSYLILHYSQNVILNEEQLKKLRQTIQNKLIFQSIIFGNQLNDLRNWLAKRRAFLKRVINTLQFYKHSKVLDHFRKDMIYYLIQFSYGEFEI